MEGTLTVPRVPYQETITSSAKAEKKYKKQSGGAGLHGHCVIDIAPVPRGTGFVWEDKIFGGSIPQNFRPSVEKGVRDTMDHGVLTGNPLVDIKVRLLDGSTHAVDGKDIAFKLAGAMAMRQAVMDAKPVLLEPIMDVEVFVPERNMGDVISDLNGKRGKIAGMEPSGDHMEMVKAQVPLSSMYRFPIDLRSITQGRGRYTMKFSHYEEVARACGYGSPESLVIAAYQKSEGGEEARGVSRRRRLGAAQSGTPAQASPSSVFASWSSPLERNTCRSCVEGIDLEGFVELSMGFRRREVLGKEERHSFVAVARHQVGGAKRGPASCLKPASSASSRAAAAGISSPGLSRVPAGISTARDPPRTETGEPGRSGHPCDEG